MKKERIKYPVNVVNKVCSGCRIEKSSDQFYRDPYHKDGLYSRCKACKAEDLKKRRKDDPEEARRIYRQSARKWREKNPEKHKEHQQNSYLRNKEKSSASAKVRGQELKIRIFNHYCNNKITCQCCGESNIRFLTLDHINNDGFTQRKLIRMSGGIGFYYWVIKNNFPDDLQVLCMNCNFGKAKNGGICPHKQEKED